MRGLLIHAGALGDSVLALRILQAMRAIGFTDLAVIARTPLCELATLAHLASTSLDIDICGFHHFFSNTPPPANSPLTNTLRDRDLILSLLGHSPDDNLAKSLSRLTAARVITLDPKPRLASRGHIVEQWFTDITAQALPLAPQFAALSQTPLFAAPPAATNSIILHPGSGSRKKCCPPDTLATLAAALNAQAHNVRSIIGPVERDTWPAREIKDFLAQVPPLTDPAQDLSLPALITQLASATAFIGHDSGVTHLAAAAGTRTFAIFGPTSPAIWRPLGPRVTIAYSPSSWPASGILFEMLSASLN